MRRAFILFLAITLVFCAIPMTASANDDGVVYKVVGDTAKVTDCDTSVSGEIVIASTYEGVPVTKIESYAFSECKFITSVVIPDTVKEIGYHSFYNCEAMQSVTMPTALEIIQLEAFVNCYALESIHIPATVTEIYEDAFLKCTSLATITVDAANEYFAAVDNVLFTKDKKNLMLYANGKNVESYTVPNSVVTIGDSAFYGCDSLKEVVIPNTVTTIEPNAFGECTSLESIVIPDSVTTLGYAAFYHCEKLQTATLSKALTMIDSYMFYYCFCLDNVVIPESITSIKEGVFSVTPRLANVYYTGAKKQWDAVEITDGNTYLEQATINYNYGKEIVNDRIKISEDLIDYRLRCETSLDGSVLTLTSTGGSSMKIRLGKLPDTAILALETASDYVTVDNEFITVKNPGVGKVTVTMSITSAFGYTSKFTLVADFGNIVTYMMRAKYDITNNVITFTSGNTNCYIGLDGTIEVVSASRNMLGRYSVNGKYIRFYNPVYDEGEVEIRLTRADGTVEEYTLVAAFAVKDYSPVVATLRSYYTISGNTVTVKAYTGVSNVYIQIGKYYAETLSATNVDTTYVKQAEAKGWKVYKSENPVEFDIIYDATASGGTAVTRHFVVDF